MSEVNYTPMQRKIMDVLGDGEPHSVTELLDHLDDPYLDRRVLKVHISLLRKKLKDDGHDVVYVATGKSVGWGYRLVGDLRNGS